MRPLFLLSLLLVSPLILQSQTGDEAAPVSVVSYKWFRDRQPIENATSSESSRPAAEMNDTNKTFERQKRANASAGDRDPNLDSVDSRSAALDRAVQDSREAQPVPGFSYVLKLQNTAGKSVEAVVVEYRFKETANPTNITRRQFACALKMKPAQSKDLRIFSLSGPSEVVDVKSLGKSSGTQFEESVFINRVEYADGSSWQRKDWSFDPSKLVSKDKSKSISMCRGL